MTAQAYKPNAPLKDEVCRLPPVHSNNNNNGTSDSGEQGGESYLPYRLARFPFWRTTYHRVEDLVPIRIRGNIYSCDNSADIVSTFTNDESLGGQDENASVLEVWQPRPDGTYSSIRPGVQDGECRASIPITPSSSESDINSFSNLIGYVDFETLAPGSPGMLGGLLPSSSSTIPSGEARSGEFPPYAPGLIHFLLNIEGYFPILAQLDMRDLSKHVASGGKEKRFRFKGSDVRPHYHATTSGKEDGSRGGMEIQSVVQSSTRPGYDLALEVEVDFYLASTAEIETHRASSTFCSSLRGYVGWIPSFFKEPIAVCFPSLLDFFAL